MKLFAALSALLVLEASGSSETRNLIFTNDTVVGDSNSTLLVPTLFTFGESENFTLFTNPEIAALFLNESAFLNFTFFEDGETAFSTTGGFANESGIDPIIFQSGVAPALNSSSTPEVIMTVTSANNLTVIPLPVEAVPISELIEPVSEEVPMTVETVTEELPMTVESVTEAVPISELIEPVSEEVPMTVETVTEAVPISELIEPVSEEVPMTVESVTEAVPITELIEPVSEEVPMTVESVTEELPMTVESVTEELPMTVESVTEAVPITKEPVTDEVPEIVPIILPIEAPITEEAVTEVVPKPDTVEPPITILIPPVLTTTNLPGSAPAPAGAPAWFDLIKAIYLSGPPIKVCAKKKNVAPVNGTMCSKKMEKTCFFGDTLCDGKPFPTTRCECTGTSDSRTWKCTTLSCPEGTP